MNLSGKVAIVTGGGRGLGLAYAQALASAGAAVVINDVDQAAADAAVALVADAGGRPSPMLGRWGRPRWRTRSLIRLFPRSAVWTSWSPTPGSCGTPCCGR